MMELETKVGVFVVTIISAFVAVVLILGNVSIGNDYKFYILFSDVSGLPAKAAIKMSGVTIGRVHKIELFEGKARVVARVKKNVKIHGDCVATIVTTGMIGAKFLDITMGTKEVALIRKGDTIEGKAVATLESTIEKFSESVNGFIDGFSEVMNGKQSPLYRTIQNLARITDKLNQGLGKDSSDIRSIIENLKGTLVAVHDISTRLDRIIESNEGIIEDDIQKFSSSLDTLQRVLNNMELVTDKLAKGEGTIGELVSDEDLAQAVRETITNIKEAGENVKHITRRVGTIKFEWNAKTRYNNRDSLARSDVGISILPSPGKYYYIGLDNISSEENGSVYDRGQQRTNSITALLGKDFNRFTLYGGAIRSTAGAGLGYAMDKNKKVKVSVSAYRFGRKLEEDTVPWFDAETSLQFARWGYLSVGVEDIFAYSGVVGSVHLVLRDDDLAYLLGLVGLSGMAQ